MSNPVQIAHVLGVARSAVQQIRELTTSNLRAVVSQAPEDYRDRLATDLLQPIDSAFAVALEALLKECKDLKITDDDRLAFALLIEAVARGETYVAPAPTSKK